MKRIFTLTLALVMLLSTVLGLASCGIDDDGAIINAYYVGEMYDFDPARAILDDDAMRVMSLLYEPLFTLDEKGRLQNALAEDYEIFRDEENGEYRMEITLKPTMWSDGMKGAVKASDVVYAWKRILEPDFESQAAPLLYAIENAVEAKTAVSDEKGHPITTEDIGAAAVNEDTISIGDSGNDLAMIRAAGTGVAMINGVEEVRAAADRITLRDNNHDAIAEVLEALVLCD